MTRLRRGTMADLDAVVAIEQAVFPAPWTRRMFEESLCGPGAAFVVAHIDQRIVGYALVRIIADEAELLTIAVALNAQRQGIGDRLMQWVIAQAQAARATMLYLEVRVSNAAAQRLYQRCGFAPCGRRVRYYQQPIEDALVMAKII